MKGSELINLCNTDFKLETLKDPKLQKSTVKLNTYIINKDWKICLQKDVQNPNQR